MPTFSDFESDSLTELTAEFRSRSKAVTYYTSDWNISRETSEDDPERLNVDAKHFNDNLRLSVWSDRVVWFRKCRGPAKNGWKFMLSFHGDASSVTSSAIVDQFIASFLNGSLSEHLAIWANESPVIERSEAPVVAQESTGLF